MKNGMKARYSAFTLIFFFALTGGTCLCCSGRPADATPGQNKPKTVETPQIHALMDEISDAFEAPAGSVVIMFQSYDHFPSSVSFTKIPEGFGSLT
jgi:hypothetical protein